MRKTAINSRNRSKVSNGGLPAGVDGRTAEARRFRDLVEEYSGGLEPVPPKVARLARRLASVSLVAEQQEARLVSGADGFDADILMRATSLMMRLQRTLDQALSRQPKGGGSAHYGDDDDDDDETLEQYLERLEAEGKGPSARPRIGGKI